MNHVVPHSDLLVFTRELASRISEASAVGTVLALYEQGEDLTINAALALEMTTYAHRPWSSAAFTDAGIHMLRKEDDDR